MEWKVKKDFEEKLKYATLSWIEKWLARFDVTELAYINLRLPVKAQTNDPQRGVYGTCYHPAKKKKYRKGIKAYYRISCTVAQKIIPFFIETHRRPIYKKEDGTWPEVPEGCREGAWNCVISKGKTVEWYKITGKTNINSFDEATVWIFGHEIFHFLRKTRQVPGRNIETEADAFADALLYCFRIDHNLDNFGLPLRRKRHVPN